MVLSPCLALEISIKSSLACSSILWIPAASSSVTPSSMPSAKPPNTEKKTLTEKRQDIQEEIQNRKNQLKVLLTQKIKDLSIASENEDLLHETYDSMQKDLMAQIHGLEIQEKELNEPTIETPNVKDKLMLF